MWFASGGVIEPPSDPKLRAQVQSFNSKTDLRSTDERFDDELVQKTREAAMQAPWWEKVSELDREKAQVYRDAALSQGIPPRPHGLLPDNDPWLREVCGEAPTTTARSDRALPRRVCCGLSSNLSGRESHVVHLFRLITFAD